ncbi:MAG: tetratricopeptide repeat protein [bacterium]|nr:tetratricopeptide repeat protein [bacterium]
MNKLLLACASLTLSQAAVADDVDVLHYRIAATIEDERIVESVTVTARAAKKVRKLELRLASSMTVRSCRLRDFDVPFEHSGWDLVVDLSANGGFKGELLLTFEVEGAPYNKQSSGHVRTVISKEHAYVRSQYAWYPRRADDLAKYETEITVPSAWRVRTAGRFIGTDADGERTKWTYSQEDPCRNIGLVAGPYEQVTSAPGHGVALDAFVYAGHEAAAKSLLTTASKAIELYGERFGAMTEEAFTLVEMPEAFGSGSGYGEVGYALIGTGAFENTDGAAWAEGLVAHEVAHTWWGREVVFSDFANEMLATYSDWRYREHVHGAEAARAERLRSVKKVARVAEERGLVALDEIRGWGSGTDSAVYTACAYDKGAMLLCMLEREMGRKAFDAALAKFFAKHRGEVVGYAELKKSLNRKFFERWEGPALPRLSVEHEVEAKGSKHRVSGKLRQEGTPKPFRMDVTVRAVRGEQAYDHEVSLKKAEASFQFTCPFEPEDLVIDPERQLICATQTEVDIEALTKAIFEVANSPKASDSARLEKTIANIRRVLAAGPDSESHYYTALGRCLFRLGKNDEAKEAFQTALKGGAGGPFHRAWVHLRLGCVADLEGDRDAAKAWYEKVLAASDAKSHDFQKQLAKRFLEKGYRGYAKDG